MKQPGRAHVVTLVIAIAMLLLAGAFVWFRLTSPFDTARLEPVQAVWETDGSGVVVSPLQEQNGGLRRGDIVIAIAGISTEAWVRALFEPGTPRPHWQQGETVIYTVMRNGQRLDIPVTLGRYPLGSALAKEWGVLLLVLLFLAVGTFIYLRRPRDRAASILFFSWSCLVAGAIAWTCGQQVSDLVGGLSFWLYRGVLRSSYLLGWLAVLHLVLIFPQPHPVVIRHPRLIWLVYTIPASLIALYIAALWLAALSPLQWLGWAYPLERLLTVIVLVLIMAVLLLSYRRAKYETITRLQIRWIVFAFVVAEGLTIAFGFVPELAFGHPLIDWNVLVFLFVPVPLAFAVAILRYRLFDIDVIINRALVYGTLSVSVIGMYVVVVSSLSTLFHTYSSFLISLVATGLVAVLFQPLRERLQRAVNRLMYGERDDPYAVLSRLGERLEATLAPEAVLPTIVETVAQALKLPYAAIALRQGETITTVASYGLPQQESEVLPLVYQTESIGQFILAPRAPNEPFTPADRRLLEDIAHQAGIAAYAVRLTTDLQRSRERLVTTREEERRRLRRDLHDGLGPQLASQTLKLDAARNLFTQNPPAAERLLVELKAQTQAIIADIRRLVYDLRPPALDELGLVSALREQIAHYSEFNGLHISMEAPEQVPPLPAAVEVAAYRIALESLTNVARHAHARTCCIRLALTAPAYADNKQANQRQDMLCLEILDDGVGLPKHYQGGVGMTSMRERAAELGGSCLVEPVMAGGTRILVRLPLPEE